MDLSNEYQCLHEFVKAARNRLNPNIWDYLIGATEELPGHVAFKIRLYLPAEDLAARAVRDVDVAGGVDELAQHGLVAHQLGVVLRVGRIGHGLGDLEQVINPAHVIEHFLIVEPVLDLHDVDRLVMIVEKNEGVEDGAVFAEVKIAGVADDLDDIADDPAVEDHRAEQGALGLVGVRRNLVEKLGEVGAVGFERCS